MRQDSDSDRLAIFRSWLLAHGSRVLSDKCELVSDGVGGSDLYSGVVRYLSNLYEVQNKRKSMFDAVEYESEVEKEFARDLDNNENVKLFVKLPSWFRIETLIGPYNPDWAFVTEREGKLYFVRETKSTLDSEERRTKENQKMACGRRHFNTIGVDYDVVTSLAEVQM